MPSTMVKVLNSSTKVLDEDRTVQGVNFYFPVSLH